MTTVWRDLLYDRTEWETLVFAPRELAEEVRATRHALDVARSWGDVRRSLSPQRMLELGEWLVAEADPDPDDDDDDDEAFPHDALSDDRAWPRLHLSDISRWLPAEVFAQYGVYHDGMLDSGTVLPADDERDITDALTALGVRCEPDVDFLENLFDEP